MFKFFKGIRRRLLKEGKLKNYLLYAFGEIILVVLGILIALQINKWNIGRVEKKEEIAILKGIKEDILRDTIDMNYNMGVYKYSIKMDSTLLNNLTEIKQYDSEITWSLFAYYTNGLNLILHQSYFEEAKSRGLKIISNSELRKEISRLYEFHYISLLKSENENDGLLMDSYDQYLKDNKLIQALPSQDDFGLFLPKDKYQQLVNDEHFHFLLKLKLEISGAMLNSKYNPVHQRALELVEKIEEELERLE